MDLGTLVTSPSLSTNNGNYTRGFTDHEQLDDLGLVHMNGRIYDPVLGRFLSTDPFVRDAGKFANDAVIGAFTYMLRYVK